MKFGVLVKHSQQGCDIFFGRFLLLIFSCGALRTPLLKHAGALLSQLHCSGDQCNLSYFCFAWCFSITAAPVGAHGGSAPTLDYCELELHTCITMRTPRSSLVRQSHAVPAWAGVPQHQHLALLFEREAGGVGASLLHVCPFWHCLPRPYLIC